MLLENTHHRMSRGPLQDSPNGTETITVLIFQGELAMTEDGTSFMVTEGCFQDQLRKQWLCVREIIGSMLKRDLSWSQCTIPSVRDTQVTLILISPVSMLRGVIMLKRVICHPTLKSSVTSLIHARSLSDC